MKTTILMFMLIWSCLNLTAQQKISGYSPEIEPYIGFIKEKQTSPATYLLEKFKTHDVIVFGERDHRDITQYYFIEKLIYMEEFYKQVSVIYTEVGSSNYNDTLNKILQNQFLSETEVDRKLLEIYRDISYQGFWEKYNFFYLWKTVFHFNQSHPEYPISIKMTSHPFDWNEITDTAVCRMKTNEIEKNYDEAMAEFFIKNFEENEGKERSKAFVIMNYPHSLRKWASKKGDIIESFFGSYINKKYSDRVCFLIVNPYTINSLQPVAHGKWDAAFKYCEYKNIGFDFRNSPFGKDTFDIWSENGILSFEELYDGMIYINPTSECESVIGIPNFIDKKFAKEFVRRIELRSYAYRGEVIKTKIRWEKEYCNNKRSHTIQFDIEYMYGDDKSKYFENVVNQWLLFE
ncbi:MAG: hypothetical protein CVU11_15425 [Bacteroidetes bacterium HGW-Bacteroidetes-6]|nr:MAG: hypothetical protein CVU11_15425 [Bacteroidetes bacterium HGW-Bacteroidetes-6]